MDVEQIAEELYGLKPAEFTAARDAYVAEARRAKDTAAARAIAALRRPALGAWTANLLARQQPEEAARFLALGETLREAHRKLDGEQLRVAGRRQHQLVGALARTAVGLAREAGQPVSDTVLHEVEQTLHAVLARPDVAEQWLKGRLVKVPDAAVDFAAVAPDEVPARPSRPAGAEEAVQTKGREREGERRRRDLERARAAAKDAEALVDRCERELGEARDERTAAEGQVEAAAGRVRGLERELHEARAAKSAAEAIVAETSAATKAAECAVREARRTAEQTADAVDRLERQSEP
ncbi:hypothetical protein [Streptomyces sp. NPDC002825]|uniref:hypothetical protein n=1 Tax=Streptomyces sp. NPDC002825 TaxID=3154666 RepID=UPI00332AB39D